LTIVTVEIVFSTSFCAVPAFIRVEPLMNSGPTSTSIGRSARRASSAPWAHASPIVSAPASRARSSAPSVYGVRPLALTPSTASRGPTSSSASSASSSSASTSVCTAEIRSVEKVGPHSAASDAAIRPDVPAPT
jgi:hypothetical protein